MISQLSTYLALGFCFVSSCLFAQEGDAGVPPRDQGLWQTLIMVGIAMMFFYFILWRPEQKRRKEMDSKRETLKKGDRVIAMGIVGLVSSVTEGTVIVKMVDGSKIEFVKAAITDVTPASELDAATKPSKDD